MATPKAVIDPTDREIASYADIGTAEVELEAWAAALTRTGRSREIGVYLAHVTGQRTHRRLMIGRHDGARLTIPGEVRQLAREYAAILRRGEDLPSFRT